MGRKRFGDYLKELGNILKMQVISIIPCTLNRYYTCVSLLCLHTQGFRAPHKPGIETKFSLVNPTATSHEWTLIKQFFSRTTIKILLRIQWDKKTILNYYHSDNNELYRQKVRRLKALFVLS